MRNLILAAMLAVSTLAPTAVPSQATSLTITTDDGMGRYGDDYYWRRHHHWRHYGMRYSDRYDDRDHWRYRRHYDRDRCYVRVHRRWHHHHWVVKRVWSCGWHRGW
ncbi:MULTISPECIES: hypothetical protein [unclassified Mesorhizobium]|uniref:hypothetical protein n=1 Tax=unclassified Mesorhizobium TaxID=325217 RepID=UPI000FD6C0EA|nr:MULTISPECIES: hypothetical protein [unclassified Mesorhizobium]TGQ46629.1 hypothetical protein EN859_002880 [Mesorhizobium sp. M00.F.Ca.ET.216.01.1.1]TIS55581.1 MAG: hypothetical protein E5W91_22110 [Mesorhizobium sp.]TIS87877.1 MAG: hypothetical protein E5W89_23145 [Mesorhizobium sp.]TJW06453.1 MAG: hypothetical protein E5W82_27905 [Mesorhizobium sp.]